MLFHFLWKSKWEIFPFINQAKKGVWSIKCFRQQLLYQVRLEGHIYQVVAHYNEALYYKWHYADVMYNLGLAYLEMLRLDMVVSYLCRHLAL
ncbi:hypothetical protein OROMI_024195 [Orobanche minor]